MGWSSARRRAFGRSAMLGALAVVTIGGMASAQPAPGGTRSSPQVAPPQKTPPPPPQKRAQPAPKAAPAPAADAAGVAAAREVFTLNDSAVDVALEQLLEVFAAGARTATPKPTDAEINQRVGRMREAMRTRRGELYDVLAKIHATGLTVQEWQAVAAHFRDGPGRRFVAVQREVETRKFRLARSILVPPRPTQKKAPAPPPAADRLAAAKDMVSALKEGESVNDYLEVAALITGVERKPEAAAAHTERMMRGVETIYARLLTAAEMRPIAAFFLAGPGAKYVKTSQEKTKETSEAVSTWFQQVAVAAQ